MKRPLFEEFMQKLLSLLNEAKSKIIKNPKNLRLINQLSYSSILLIQLVNGCRISEAIDGWLAWVKTGKKEILVQVRKQRKNPEFRTVVIPHVLDDATRRLIIAFCEGVIKRAEDNIRRFIQAISMWAKRKGISIEEVRVEKRGSKTIIIKYTHSTHALRHAFMTYLGEKKVPAQVIQKITRHKDIRQIPAYTLDEIAKKILRNLAKNLHL